MPLRELRAVSLLLLWGIIVAGGQSHAGAEEQGAAAARIAADRVLVIGHRGASHLAPENTLPAFAAALAAGADLVELDYHHSADGIPVAIHDETLDRTTDAVALWGGKDVKVAGKTLAQLQQLDAGGWFSPQFAGTRLPTLAEALDAIQAGSLTLIERKAGDPATCVNLLVKKKLLDQVVVQAFDWEFLARCHHLAPQLMLGALGEKELSPERLDEIAATGASVVGWRDRDSTAATIAAIHSRGWKAWVWTVDDEKRACELVAAGADGIITNRPAEIRRAIGDVDRRGRDIR